MSFAVRSLRSYRLLTPVVVLLNGASGEGFLSFFHTSLQRTGANIRDYYFNKMHTFFEDIYFMASSGNVLVKYDHHHGSQLPVKCFGSSSLMNEYVKYADMCDKISHYTYVSPTDVKKIGQT